MKGTLPRYRPVVVRKVGMEEGPNASRSDLFFGIENFGAQHLFFSSKETLSLFCLVRLPGHFWIPNSPAPQLDPPGRNIYDFVSAADRLQDSGAPPR